MQDLATQWIQAYPCKNKTSQETQRSLQKFLDPERKPKVIYTDNSLEFGKACEDLSWNHCTSTPHRSETNGIAERGVVLRAEFFGDLITADHKISKHSPICNCCTRLSHSIDSILSVQNKNFTGNREELAKDLGAVQEIKSFTMTDLWNLAKPAKTYRGIIAHQPFTDQKQMGLLERAVRRIKEGTSAVLSQSRLDENWRADSMECYCYLQKNQDTLSDGKTLHYRRFGAPFKAHIVPFASLVEYLLMSTKDQSRIHQIGKKVLPGIFLGVNLGRRHTGCGL